MTWETLVIPWHLFYLETKKNDETANDLTIKSVLILHDTQVVAILWIEVFFKKTQLENLRCKRLLYKCWTCKNLVEKFRWNQNLSVLMEISKWEKSLNFFNFELYKSRGFREK